MGNILNRVDSSEDINELIKYSNHRWYEVRLHAYERLEDYFSEEIRPCIHYGLEDKNEIIRVTCLEILESNLNPDTEELIIKSLHDKYELVRAKAIMALGSTCNRDYIKLFRYLEINATNYEKVHIYRGFYKFGMKEYLSEIFKMLSDDLYLVRCITSSILSNLADKENKEQIFYEISKALETEITVAAVSSFQNALRKIKKV